MKTLALLFALFLAGVPLLRGQAAPKDPEARLSALEKAFRAGILTRKEYEKKKAEILASLPRSGAGTEKKLRALEEARRAGIFSREEYEKKKALLLGKGGPASLPKGKGFSVYQDPEKRFSFRYPAAWKAVPFPNGRGVNVKSGDWAFSVLFFPGVGAPAKVLSAVQGQVARQWEGFKVLGRGARKVSGVEAQVVDFQGVNPKKVASRSQLAAFCAGKGTYLLILAAPLGKAREAVSLWEGFYGSFRLGGKEAPGGGKTGGASKGRIYKHPIGFTFWYPLGWAVLEGKEGGLRLLPPGDKPADPRPGRFVFVIGDSVAGRGISSPADPRVGAFLDKAVTSMLPLRRIGRVEGVVSARGKGAEYNWSGKNLQGKTILARAFATILGDFGVALVMVGFEDELKSLDGPARKIFSSFGFDEGAKDPALVGRWVLVSTGTIYNGSPLVDSGERARGYSRTRRELSLGADGSWTRVEVTRTLVLGAGTSLSSGPGKKVTRGKWRAGAGTLYLMGEDQTWEDYSYRVGKDEAGPLLVLTSGKTRETWRPK